MQRRARSCSNCPPGSWQPQLFRDNSWQSGWHQLLLLTLFVTVLVDTVQTHTHAHAHTPVDSYLLSYSTAGPLHARASLDRWPPSTPTVGRHDRTARQLRSAHQPHPPSWACFFFFFNVTLFVGSSRSYGEGEVRNTDPHEYMVWPTGCLVSWISSQTESCYLK